MLKINTKLKKYKIPLITMVIVINGIFLFQYLTFIPEYSSAEEISTPVYEKNGLSLSDIGNMQDITYEICSNSRENETKQLIDERDDKSYWVTKLKDGNCWMTQNLDYDDPDSTKATDSSGINGGPASANWVEDANVRQYWDPGEKVVSDSRLVERKNDTDAHLLVGNYYSWLAVTNGTAPIDSNTPGWPEATGSICPNGWELPTSNKSKGPTFSNLQSSYSIGSVGSKFHDDPLYYLYSGNVISGELANVGSNGWCWSSTAGRTFSAQVLLFTPSSVSASFNPIYDNRYYGFPARCVARGEVSMGNLVLDNPNLSVIVDKILTLEVTDKEVNIEPKTNEIMTGDFTATVSSNAGYDIGLSAAEGSPIALVNKKDNVVIAEISASNNIQVGTNGWGIKCVDDEDCILKSYNALTLYNNPQVYFSSANAVTNKPTNFEVGIGISSSLPSGTYSTNILVTASQK